MVQFIQKNYQKIMVINFMVGFCVLRAHAADPVSDTDASRLARTPTAQTNDPDALGAPSYVYLATVTEPASIFMWGMERTEGIRIPSRTTDLSEHLYQGFVNPYATIIERAYPQRENPSAFISTFANREYAFQQAESYTRAYSSNYQASERIVSIYVYQIVPRDNFISVTDTYVRALGNQRDERIFQNLRNLSRFYTDGNEYAALHRIPTNSIVLATRYRYDRQQGRYLEFEVENNPNYNAAIVASVHPNNYPIGSIPDFERIREARNCAPHCHIVRPSAGQSSIQKREVKTSHDFCPTFLPKNLKLIEMPNDMFKKNAIKFEVNIGNKDKKYCLAPYNNYYLGIDECNKYANNKWLYTDFGQLIAEINDGKNNQYYCLSAPSARSASTYLTMGICDLNKKEQSWSLKNQMNGEFLLMSSSGKLVGSYNGFYNNYAYLIDNTDKTKVESDLVKVLNIQEIQKNISQPLIQFSFSPVFEERIKTQDLLWRESYYSLEALNIINKIKFITREYIIYPTKGGNVYKEFPPNVEEYQNYYNAHNNSFFSNDGNQNGGAQVCYRSDLVYNGRSAWDWVKSYYCSTQGKLSPEYQWFLKKSEENKDKYKIVDLGNNVLRSNEGLSYLYTANTDWTDSSKFSQNFTFLNAGAIKYANAYSFLEGLEIKNGVKNKEHKLSYSFDHLYSYYNKLNKEMIILNTK